jgi:hypothetical protein
MGWRETEHKGGKLRLVLSCAKGDALAVGVTSVRGGERERECEPVRQPVLPRDPPSSLHEGPGPSFYRCKERIQVYNGGVAIH